MTRDNNIYGKLVNNKFSDLLTADMDTTWLQMSAILDREMPQDMERRRALWVSWRSAGTIIAIVLLASSIAYYSFNKQADGAILPGKNNVQGNNISKETDPVQNLKESNDEEPVLFDSEASQEFLAMITPNDHSLATSQHFANNIPAGPVNHSITQQTNNYNAGINIISPEPALFHLNAASGSYAGMVDQSLTNYTGEGNTSEKTVFHKRYLISAMPLAEGLSTDKLLAKGDLVIPGHLSTGLPGINKLSHVQRKMGWVLGAAIFYNAPLSNQEMSTLNSYGKKNTLVDFIPSVFVQYHLNNKWYVETGFQYSSPQYTADHKLFSSCVDVAAGKRKERAVWLNKLYYMNIPLSVHFYPFNGLSIGTGIQYSRLQKSILMDEHASWKENNSGEWEKTYSSATANSTKKSTGYVENYSGTGSTWGTPGAANSPSEEGVQIMSQQFKGTDWRYLLDVNYTWKRYTLGTRYTAGINDYINTNAYRDILQVKDKNKAVQFYLRMNVLDKRKTRR